MKGIKNKRITFGKYKDRLLKDILASDQKWIQSMLRLGKLVLPKHLKP